MMCFVFNKSIRVVAMKFHDVAILLFCVALAFLVVEVGTQAPAVGAPKQGAPKDKSTKSTTKTPASANTVQWSDLVKGGKLPYGGNVTLAGKLSDLTCGSQPISNVLDITAISVSYLGQTSPVAAATIATVNSTTTANGATANSTGANSAWTAPLGSLPADTAVSLQLKITGHITSAKQAEIVNDLLADPLFQRDLDVFIQRATGQASAIFGLEAQAVLTGISEQGGPLTKILQDLLPSCAVVTDVTSAAMKGLQANKVELLALPGYVKNFAKVVADIEKLDDFDAAMTASDLDAFIKSKTGKFAKDGKPLSTAAGNNEAQLVANAAKAFEDVYQPVLKSFGGDVVAQLSQGVALTQSSTTQDINKYAGFDAGALYAPRINELRGYYMVHIYPFGPVELAASGKLNALDRWSIALGESSGDLSSNGASRVKGDKAFVYGLGFRINKYFRVSTGGMVYRDTVGNRLLNEWFIGPSIDITALPGLKSVFASPSSKSTSASGK
jgi:hypothetical protein